MRETNELYAKRITSAEASYLQHMGEIQGVKVSIGFVDGYPVLHIRDFEFWTFEKALMFLKHTATEIVDNSDRDEVQP